MCLRCCLRCHLHLFCDIALRFSEDVLTTSLHSSQSPRHANTAYSSLPFCNQPLRHRRLQVAKEAAEVATKVKGSWSNGIAEEHVAWVPLVSGLREYAEALEAGGAPQPLGVRTLPSGQHILDVCPTGRVASPNRI